MGEMYCDVRTFLRGTEWRLDEIDPIAYEYLECVSGAYDAERIVETIATGAKLVGQVVSFFLAYRHAQEIKMRELNGALERIEGKSFHPLVEYRCRTRSAWGDCRIRYNSFHRPAGKWPSARTPKNPNRS